MRLVVEYCPSGTLKEYLNSNRISNENDFLNILKEISEGVHFLHKDFRNESQNKRSPIAHRDLKSENILFFNSTRLVICDFAMSTQIQFGTNNKLQVWFLCVVCFRLIESVLGRHGSLHVA